MKSSSLEFICHLPVHAASGLVIHKGNFFIASDDEVHLLTGWPEIGFTPYKLWDEALPEEEATRKKVKPDFETLFMDGDELFVLPSFSRKNRNRGATIRLGDRGEILSHKVSTFENLRRKLDVLVPDLNVEGAVRRGGSLHLFQRGNGERGVNSVIIMEHLGAEEILVRPISLPEVRGVPYTITDAALRGAEIWFLAVAEDTESTYLDGEVLGSAIGRLDESFSVSAFSPLDFKGKPEGMAFDERGQCWLVTDDDSRERPSRLFRYGF